jgi:sporulation protein YlmC with PRC-barrel domain
MRQIKSGGHAKPARVGGGDSHLLGVQSLLANKLYDADGNCVGRLEEIVLDVRTGCVRHAIVAMGGFLGIGRRRFAVPWSALQPDARYCRAVVDVAQMRLTAVPIPDGDPWLRNAASSPGFSPIGLDRTDRAIGAAD